MVLKPKGGQRRRRPVEPRNVSVTEFARQWLEREQVFVQPKTLASFRETTNRYIVPAIGLLQVRDVESEDIDEMLQRAVAKSRKGQLSANTLRIIRATCSLMFKDAKKRLKLDRNPCADVDMRLGKLSQTERQKSVRNRVMSYEQLRRVLQAAKQTCTRRDFVVFLALAETGARPCEVLALQWSDLDVDNRRLRIERAVTLGGQIRPTKTKAMRTVPLTVPLAEALTSWRRHVERTHAKAKLMPPSYVFASRSGQALQAKAIGRRFSTLTRSIGLPSSFTLYSLRHSFCSQLLDQGVKPVDVARLMGHRNVTTTLTFYADALPKDDTQDIDRLTAARQALGDLNGDFVRTTPRGDLRNPTRRVAPRAGLEPATP